MLANLPQLDSSRLAVGVSAVVRGVEKYGPRRNPSRNSRLQLHNYSKAFDEAGSPEVSKINGAQGIPNTDGVVMLSTECTEDFVHKVFGHLDSFGRRGHQQTGQEELLHFLSLDEAVTIEIVGMKEKFYPTRSVPLFKCTERCDEFGPVQCAGAVPVKHIKGAVNKEFVFYRQLWHTKA
ncbi:hypothetical protein PHYBOEH_008630 [Phytophthora boehmeriae]|uniref:Uncharacterized protein n=1 Tax=Phytophthora boehmeriae TaxID=109152 RepID=A0A8T1W024_9STRA|nr:hypothetical protein PHYBOEH_008630 [Phytophthora boehmeriae]